MPRKKLIRLLERVRPKKIDRWLRSALRRTGNRADAEDVVQEAVARTVVADPDVDNSYETDSYVMKAIRDVAADLRRRRSTRRRLQHVVEETAGQSREPMSPEARALRVAAQRTVARELPRLPAKLRRVIELRYLRDPPWTLEEIALQQGVAKSTVHRRIGKALELLADAVQRGGEVSAACAEAWAGPNRWAGRGRQTGVFRTARYPRHGKNRAIEPQINC